MNPLKIMLVDDNPEFLGVAADFLSGHPAMEIAGLADSGAKAMQMVSELFPDLVLLDLSMPGMNGLEVTRKIKARFPTLCVIMLTFYEGSELYSLAQSAGVDAFLTKSEFGESLLPLIARLFPQYRIEPANEPA